MYQYFLFNDRISAAVSVYRQTTRGAIVNGE